MRLYTVEEARALLPRLIPLLVDLRELARILRGHMEATAQAQRTVPGNGHLGAPLTEDANAALKRSHERWGALTRELEELGVELKDPESGLIDFYHERDGEIVYLCYRLGEPDIAWWHTLDGGFAGRRPI